MNAGRKTSARIAGMILTGLGVGLWLIGEILAGESSLAMEQKMLDADGYYLGLSYNDRVEMVLDPGGDCFAGKKETIRVKHNIPNGYKLYLSMNNNDANGGRLYLNGDKTSQYYFNVKSNTGIGELTSGS